MKLQMLKLCDCGHDYVAAMPLAKYSSLSVDKMMCPICKANPIIFKTFDIETETD